jgi:hypothetical protein
MAKSKSKQAEALQLLNDLDSFTPIDAPPPESSVSNGGTSTNIPGGRTSTSSRRSATPSGTGVSPSSNAGAKEGGGGGETAEALAFLDEIQQKASEPISRPSSSISVRSGTPTVRKSTERVKLGGGTPSSLLSHGAAAASASATSLHRQVSSDAAGTKAGTGGTGGTAASSGGGGWGWGTVWNTASAALQQAKSAVDEQVKHLPKNEQARKWGEDMLEYAKNAQLEKLSRYSYVQPESLANEVFN